MNEEATQLASDDLSLDQAQASEILHASRELAAAINAEKLAQKEFEHAARSMQLARDAVLLRSRMRAEKQRLVDAAMGITSRR